MYKRPWGYETWVRCTQKPKVRAYLISLHFADTWQELETCEGCSLEWEVAQVREAGPAGKPECQAGKQGGRQLDPWQRLGGSCLQPALETGGEVT